jgi:signal transduction histidine kinase
MSDAEEDERLVALVHDLRTPLTIVQGFADLLARRGSTLSEEERDEYVARIAAAAGEMKSILDDERSKRLSAS